MKYTVRFAHLKYKSALKVGDYVNRGDSVGTMGTTGKSTGPHLHIDCVRGSQLYPWRQSQCEELAIVPAPKQLNYFIDDELFKYPILIGAYYCDPKYMANMDMLHFAYDVEPEHPLEKPLIYWNRSMYGLVIATGHDPGYGYYIHIEFEA